MTLRNAAVYYCVYRDEDMTGYRVKLEAATSCGAKLEDDRMTYLNKGLSVLDLSIYSKYHPG